MIGMKFHNWEVLRQVKSEKAGRLYECMCSCGNIRVKAGTELRAGRGKQCQECQYRTMYDPEREIGKKYGKWKIVKYIGLHKDRFQQYETICECGKEGKHLAVDLRAGKSTQCVICHNRQCAKKNIQHGMHNTLQYKVWTAMLERCRNPKSTSYRWYGGRGISFDPRWDKFNNFYEDMGERPEGMTLDRIDNDGDYSKENCRWVSHKENCQNRYKRK